LRGDRHQRVHEAHPRRLDDRGAVTREQVADLVLRIVQDERHLIELVRRTQSKDEPLEQLVQRGGTQQLQLALLGLAQQRVVAGHFLGKGSEARLQEAVFLLQRGEVRGRRIARQRLGLSSAHPATILLGTALRDAAPIL